MEEALWDAGRVKMQYMMKRKQELREERDACIKAGDCPDLYNIDSEGFAPCIDGKSTFYIVNHHYRSRQGRKKLLQKGVQTSRGSAALEYYFLQKGGSFEPLPAYALENHSLR